MPDLASQILELVRAHKGSLTDPDDVVGRICLDLGVKDAANVERVLWGLDYDNLIDRTKKRVTITQKGEALDGEWDDAEAERARAEEQGQEEPEEELDEALSTSGQVLNWLAAQGPLRGDDARHAVARLSDVTDTTRTNVTRVLRELEADGYIEREVRGNRTTYLAMTEGRTEGGSDREEERAGASGDAPSHPPSTPVPTNGDGDELRDEYVRALIRAIETGHVDAHVCDRVERLLGVA